MAKEVTGGEFMLFGVRVVVDSMRKSVSLNNLSQYEHRLDSSSSNDVVPTAAAGYASADDAAVVTHSSNTTAVVSRERKRGVPWTEDEHKLFLLGLQKVGKGDWRGISRNFVKTRTPTQVASHAQKYYLRRSNLNRRRRRSSLFDITTDSVAASQSNDQQIDNNGVSESSPIQQVSPNSEISNIRFSSPTAPIYPSTTSYNHETNLVRVSSTSSSNSTLMADFDLNKKESSSTLSLNLSLSMTSSDLANSRTMAFKVMQGFNNGDCSISVA